MLIDQAHAYMRAIRKPAKRAYAEQYWNWLVDRIVTDRESDPPEPSNLGTMAAQAVRMNLDKFAGAKIWLR